MRKIAVATLVAFACFIGVADAGPPSSPAWTPGLGSIEPVGAGTGGAVCDIQAVRIDPQGVAVDLSTQQTTGTVVIEGRSQCSTIEPGIDEDMTLGLYRQNGNGLLDTTTLWPSGESPWPWAPPANDAVTPASFTLLGSTTCRNVDPTTGGICQSRPFTFTNTPGSRIVAVLWGTYTLVDPRGGAWFAEHPFCDVSPTTFTQIRCVVSAELRD